MAEDPEYNVGSASRHPSVAAFAYEEICGMRNVGSPVRSRERFLVFGAPDIQREEIDDVVACLQSGWIGTGPSQR